MKILKFTKIRNIIFVVFKELVNELYNKTTTQSDSKQELYDYICKLFNLEEPHQ